MSGIDDVGDRLVEALLLEREAERERGRVAYPNRAAELWRNANALRVEVARDVLATAAEIDARRQKR